MSIFQIIQFYSVLWMSAILLGIVAFFLFRNRKPGAGEIIAFGVIALGLVAAWLVIRPQQTPLMGEAAEVQAKIGAGQAVLLEFQSPY